jgi:hypothetical protein
MNNPTGELWRKPQGGIECRFPGCSEFVSGNLWGCRRHWMLVSMDLRDKYQAASRNRDRDAISAQVMFELIANGHIKTQEKS